MNKEFSNTILIILITTFSISTLSCNVLSWLDSGIRNTSEIEEKLNENGMILLRDVVSTKDNVMVSIEVPASESPFEQFITWVYIFEQVVQSAPDVKDVVISLFFLDESYLSVTAQAEDIQAFINDELDPIAFIDSLTFDDQRKPGLILQQALEDLGWIVTAVNITEDRVKVVAFPPDAQTHSEILLDWIEALEVTAKHAPDVQQIIFHLLLIETPNMTITINMADLIAFQNGEMDEVNFLANWVLSE